jgi:hypothetical protein
MKRTTIMAEEKTVNRLQDLARDRGVSFAEVVREALEEKAREYRPRPRSLGLFDSGRKDVSTRAGMGRTPPR